MIYGIGTDIVAVARMEGLLARYGEHFARRILRASEWDEYATSHTPGRFLAKRFAAKEALAKAVGTGLRYPVRLTHIAVGHDALGKPMLQFSSELEQFLTDRGIGPRHLSISDEKEVVSAFVVLESRGGQ
jgi:holo-[acyl-carrier protein] synthase